MNFNLLVAGGWDTDWCPSGHQKTRFYLRGKNPHFKFWILVQAAGRNQGTERSKILKLAEVVSSVSPCPLIVYQREPRGDQHVSEWFSTRTLSSRYRHPWPRQYYISLPPTPPISYYWNLHKTQEAGRKYILFYFGISLVSIFTFLNKPIERVKLIKYIFRWDGVRTEIFHSC